MLLQHHKPYSNCTICINFSHDMMLKISKIKVAKFIHSHMRWSIKTCTAAAPSPEKSSPPSPAKVVIIPLVSTFLILFFSLMNKFPEGSRITSYGSCSCALTARPPSPAKFYLKACQQNL